MTILNIGSINIDHVYEVDHFVRPGETLGSSRYQVFAGGKGFNQSVALARAGAAVRHVGKVGREAEALLRQLQQEGVDTSTVLVGDDPTGHAIIQVTPAGENAIVLYGGANQRLSPGDVREVLSHSEPGGVVLLQNETSAVPDAIRFAHDHGMKVVLNPAPMSPEVLTYPLDLVDLLVLNETEAEALTGTASFEETCAALWRIGPETAFVLTRGREGAWFVDATTQLHEPALQVEVVDTTAAGDTFLGFFLADYLRHHDPARALRLGTRAAALCVTRPGASPSIPSRQEVDDLEG